MEMFRILIPSQLYAKLLIKVIVDLTQRRVSWVHEAQAHYLGSALVSFVVSTGFWRWFILIFGKTNTII